MYLPVDDHRTRDKQNGCGELTDDKTLTQELASRVILKKPLQDRDGMVTGKHKCRINARHEYPTYEQDAKDLPVRQGYTMDRPAGQLIEKRRHMRRNTQRQHQCPAVEQQTFYQELPDEIGAE